MCVRSDTDAEKIGVSRQIVAKWEAGETIPDILNCDAMARLYDVELKNLIHHDAKGTGLVVKPKGKAFLGGFSFIGYLTPWKQTAAQGPG